MIKLAVFDVDGTLFDGNLGIEYLKILISKKLFDEKIGKEIFGWYEKYKTGVVEKSIVVDEIYKLYALGMTGLDEDTAAKTASQTMQTVSEKIFPFSEKLIKTVKEHNYFPLFLSGSPIEMIKEFGKLLNVTNFVAGTIELKNGKYSGKIISYPGSAEQKVLELNKFISHNNFDVDFSNSLAMGDNERDFEILKMVGRPLAFEPNEALKSLANEAKIKIVNRENLLSELIELN